MRSFVVVLLLALCFATIVSADGPAQLMGSVEAVYHEGLVTFQVQHVNAVSISIKVYDLSTDALVYDSGPRARSQVSWPAGHDLVGAFRYVVTAWNDQGEVVVSQVAVTKNLTPITNITFDTIPGNTKFLGPNEVIIESDLQVGATQGVRLDQDVAGHGGGFYLYEENGSTFHARSEPDAQGGGNWTNLTGGNSNSYLLWNGNGSGTNGKLSVMGENSDFIVDTNSYGNSSVVMPGSAVSATEMSNEPGVAAEYSGDDLVLTTSPLNTIVRTINVPSDGYIMATAVVGITLFHTGEHNSEVSCSISETSAQHSSGGVQTHTIPKNVGNGVFDRTIPMTRIFPVTTGAHTLHVVCNKVAYCTATAINRHLNILFVPTAYGTVTTEITKNSDGHMEGVEGDVPSTTSMTQAEIDAERAESIAFNLARIQAELADLQAQADALTAGSDNNQP